jgi:hypothetical protein
MNQSIKRKLKTKYMGVSVLCPLILFSFFFFFTGPLFLCLCGGPHQKCPRPEVLKVGPEGFRTRDFGQCGTSTSGMARYDFLTRPIKTTYYYSYRLILYRL